MAHADVAISWEEFDGLRRSICKERLYVLQVLIAAERDLEKVRPEPPSLELVRKRRVELEDGIGQLEADIRRGGGRF